MVKKNEVIIETNTLIDIIVLVRTTMLIDISTLFMLFLLEKSIKFINN